MEKLAPGLSRALGLNFGSVPKCPGYEGVPRSWCGTGSLPSQSGSLSLECCLQEFVSPSLHQAL